MNLANIKLLALDVDGILTDGRVWFDGQGEQLKPFHTQDGLGIKLLLEAGIEVAIITGRYLPDGRLSRAATGHHACHSRAMTSCQP